ncbi:dihydrofolate reductase [Corynebacterium sp. CNJ-954]|uniref:dihydrofolate reductase n=1 Tax=Corynebacterium sp. CNJ-954 TaxID=1904962 RepID=UPI00350EBF2D
MSDTPSTSTSAALSRRDLRDAGLPDDVEIAMIWAQTSDGVIGDGSDMPWYLPEDLEHFKNSTVGAPVVMGRISWEALDPRFRPLPGRDNVVITRNSSYAPRVGPCAPRSRRLWLRHTGSPRNGTPTEYRRCGFSEAAKSTGSACRSPTVWSSPK